AKQKSTPAAKDVVVAVAELANPSPSGPPGETGIVNSAPASGTNPSPTSAGRTTKTLMNNEAPKAGNSNHNHNHNDSPETSNVNPPVANPTIGGGGKTLSSFLGSLTKRPKELVSDHPAPAPAPAAPAPPSGWRASRPTPSPLPLQPRNSMSPVDLQSDSEEDEEEMDSEDDDFADVTMDVYPGSQSSGQPSSPSIFYPTSSSNHHLLHSHHHHHHRPVSTSFQIPEPRKPLQPLRSHINLLQLTTSSLQHSPSPHPLIAAPRSSSGNNGGAGGNSAGSSSAGGSSNSSNGAPLFPRSCNLTSKLPASRSVLVALHKTRVICRLESPGSLTAAEELSIMPFATRMPGSRGPNGTSANGDRSSSGPANAMYPSSSYRGGGYRSSLMRNLALEEGDLIREVDVNAGTAASGNSSSNAYPTFSKGLKRWLARPPFEQRMVSWTPVSSGDAGFVRSAVHRPSLMGPAVLEFSQGVEALAGVVRPRVAWTVGGARFRASVTQGELYTFASSFIWVACFAPGDTLRDPVWGTIRLIVVFFLLAVVAPLHHPKPTMRFGKPPDGAPTLVIPPPPLLSSSPSSTTSLDTAPNTPGSNNSSSQNLTSFVPPAFLKRLRQSSIAYVDPNISDEDDVPLGVVVINKHSDDRGKPVASPSKDDPQERARRLREKEKERERKKTREAERMKAFKDQVLASRVRREAHRAGGRYGPTSLSQDWIEVDKATSANGSGSSLSTSESRGGSSAPGGTARPQRSSTAPSGVPTNSSATSIGSQSSSRSRPATARPPSIVGSEVSYQSARTNQTRSTQHRSQPQRQQSSGPMGMMPMMTTAPIMVYNSPFSPMSPNGMPTSTPPYPPQFFAPPPPPLPVPATSTTRSTKSSSSRRDSGYGEFGQQQQQQQQQSQQQQQQKSQHFWTMPSRRSSRSATADADKRTSEYDSSVFGLEPPRPRFASSASNDSSSDNGSLGKRSVGSRSGKYSSSVSASRRSSMLAPPV
ncbi:hypothetical protein FRB90_007117, partial [Tulasnella sp. 427]